MNKQEIIEWLASITRDRFKQPSEASGLNWDENFNYLLAEDIYNGLKGKGMRPLDEDQSLPDVRHGSEVNLAEGIYDGLMRKAEMRAQQDMIDNNWRKVKEE